MVLVGKQAPDWKLKAVKGTEVVEDFTLSQYRGKKYVLLFFYPFDFTFVCPTELLAFQERIEEFKSKNVEVIGASIDSEFSHFAWLQMPVKEGGIEGVKYPIIADVNKTLAKDYDVLTDEGFALRGLFLIDKEGMVKHQLVNAPELGRSVDEALRLVEALQFTEEHGEVCPANWDKNSKGMKATKDGIKEYHKD